MFAILTSKNIMELCNNYETVQMIMIMSFFQHAKAINFMKKGVNMCIDVHVFLVELNNKLCICYRGTNDGQVCID